MVVLDTSVIYKWFTDTELKRDEAKLFLIDHLNKTQPILIPDLLLYEITNAWATKTALSLESIQENIVRLESYVLTILPVTYSLVLKATELSKTYQISVYDAIYIVLAGEKKCKLITADEKLVQKVSLPFVLRL